MVVAMEFDWVMGSPRPVVFVLGSNPDSGLGLNGPRVAWYVVRFVLVGIGGVTVTDVLAWCTARRGLVQAY